MAGKSQSKRSRATLINLGLAVGGVVVALLLAQGFIALFPGLLPAFLRPDPFDIRQPHADDEEAVFTVSGGDLFVLQPGYIAPPPDPDEVLARFSVSHDEDGFRRPFVEADSYPIIVLGDSFTEGAHVPKPWPDVLADQLATPVRNLGFRGYGPREYARVMEVYGTSEPHQWVVIGFFEGNDFLSSLARDEEPFSLPSVALQAFEAAESAPEFDPESTGYGEGPWKYPLDMQLGNRTRPLVIYEDFFWPLNGLPELYENSNRMAALRGFLAEIQADAGEACVLMVYIPDKGHIYFPYVNDPADQQAVLQGARRVDLGEDSRLVQYAVPTTQTELVSRLDSMSVAVGNVAREMGLHWLDLTPALKEAAARGKETYYVYDTHFNQLGHDITGEMVAAYIKEQPGCGL